MKKFGTRLISAVLAGCMMASVLPVSAFAQGGTGSETGVSAQASENQGRILEDGEEITESGTYSMSGPYTKTVTINVPDGNVVINITGPVVNSNLGRTDNALLIRNGTVTINNLQNNEFSVTSGRCIRVDVSTGAKATVTMNGGIYKSSGIETLFNFYGTVYLHDVTSFSEYDNALNNWGTAYVYGGKYESKSSAPAVYNRISTSRIELNDDVEVSNESGCPVTNIGTADINGGRYTSQSTSLCINTTANSTTNIHGGTFEGKGTVICNRGKMTIDETKGKTEIRVAGNQTDLPRSGVRTEANAITDIHSATIENAQYGIWNKENASSVTLKDAAFKDNENDVYLEAGQYITIEDTFTDTATVKVADSPIATPRQITTADATGQEKLNLVSNDKDAEGKTYFVAYDAVNNYRYSSALKSQGLVSGKKEWESSNSIRDMIVAYFAEHSPVAPEVDNNWKIVGVDLQETNPDRATLIALVNQGKIDAPYSKSLNLNDPAVQEILNDKSNAALRNWNRVKMFFTTK